MRRLELFTFRVSKDERRLISSLAEMLKRSQSDAVRFIVLAAAKELASQDDHQIEKDTKAKQLRCGTPLQEV